MKYTDKITFAGDLRILIGTIVVVFKRAGISSQTSATMEEFKGNEK